MHGAGAWSSLLAAAVLFGAVGASGAGSDAARESRSGGVSQAQEKPFAVSGAAADAAPVDFTTEVRPILSDRCFTCHGPDAAKRKARLRLDTREGMLKVVTPGDPDASELVHRIFTDDKDDVMPPPESNLVLTAAEKDVLRRWIADGADYRTLWSFEPVRRVEVPGSPRAQRLSPTLATQAQGEQRGIRSTRSSVRASTGKASRPRRAPRPRRSSVASRSP
jgi:hypothetical protein